jgi:hypothetical protein
LRYTMPPGVDTRAPLKMHSWLTPFDILRFLLSFAFYHRSLLLRTHWDTKTSALVTVSLSFDSITWLLKGFVDQYTRGESTRMGVLTSTEGVPVLMSNVST